MPTMTLRSGGSQPKRQVVSDYSFDDTVQSIREGGYVLVYFPKESDDRKYAIFTTADLEDQWPDKSSDDILRRPFVPNDHLDKIKDRIEKKGRDGLKVYHTNEYKGRCVVYVLGWPNEEDLMCTKTNFDKVISKMLNRATSAPSVVQVPAEAAVATSGMERSSRQEIAVGNSLPTGGEPATTTVSYPAMTPHVPVDRPASPHSNPMQQVPQMMQAAYAPSAPVPPLTSYNVPSSQNPTNPSHGTSPSVQQFGATRTIAPTADYDAPGSRPIPSIEQVTAVDRNLSAAWNTHRPGSKARSSSTPDPESPLRPRMRELRSGEEVVVRAKHLLGFLRQLDQFPPKTQCIVYIPSQDIWTKRTLKQLDELVKKEGIHLQHQDGGIAWNPEADESAWKSLRRQWTEKDFRVVGLAFRTSTKNKSLFYTTVIVEPLDRMWKEKVQQVRSAWGYTYDGPLRVSRTCFKLVGTDEMLRKEAMRTKDGRAWWKSLGESASQASQLRRERSSITPEKELAKALLSEAGDEDDEDDEDDEYNGDDGDGKDYEDEEEDDLILSMRTVATALDRLNNKEREEFLRKLSRGTGATGRVKL